jgi:cytochrome b561
MADRRRPGYSGIQISLHWIIAALVLFQLLFGESMTQVRDAAETGAPSSATDQTLATAHYWVGISILVLIVVRLAVRLINGAPQPLGQTMTVWAAKIVHAVFYILLFAVPATGLLTVYVSDTFGDIHSLGKPIFICLIAAHALGALYHQFWHRDGTLKRIVVPER